MYFSLIWPAAKRNCARRVAKASKPQLIQHMPCAVQDGKDLMLVADDVVFEYESGRQTARVRYAVKLNCLCVTHLRSTNRVMR